MKKIIIIIFLLLPAHLFAQDTGAYIEGQTGLTLTDDITKDYNGESAKGKFKLGHTVGVGLGFHLGSGLRTEFDYAYRTVNLDEIKAESASASADAEGHARAHSIMANLYKDFFVSEKFALYIGGGIGGAREKLVVSKVGDIEGEFLSDSVWETAFQVSTGFSTKISDGIYGTLGYKFFKTTGEITSHNVEFGMRFNMY